jgi:hypothetical protein
MNSGPIACIIRVGCFGLIFSVLDLAAQSPASIQWDFPNYSVAENGGSASVTLSRTGNLASVATVDFATADGTANAGSDYVAQSTTVRFAAGETSKTLRITIVDDPFVEGDETVKLILSNPGPAVALGDQATATLTIQDNERPVTLVDDFNPQSLFNNQLFSAVPMDDGRVVVATMDCSRSPCSGRISRLMADGSLDPSFTAVTGISASANYGLNLQALAVQPDGYVLIGGNFVNVAGVAAKGIARIDGKGSLLLFPGCGPRGDRHSQPRWHSRQHIPAKKKLRGKRQRRGRLAGRRGVNRRL